MAPRGTFAGNDRQASSVQGIYVSFIYRSSALTVRHGQCLDVLNLLVIALLNDWSYISVLCTSCSNIACRLCSIIRGRHKLSVQQISDAIPIALPFEDEHCTLIDYYDSERPIVLISSLLSACLIDLRASLLDRI
jgi:hypothetical protein